MEAEAKQKLCISDPPNFDQNIITPVSCDEIGLWQVLFDAQYHLGWIDVYQWLASVGLDVTQFIDLA